MVKFFLIIEYENILFFGVFTHNKTTITISLLTTKGNASDVSDGSFLYKANFFFEKKIAFKDNHQLFLSVQLSHSPSTRTGVKRYKSKSI